MRSSNAEVDIVQSSKQKPDAAHHQEAVEVTADGERGLLSDTKSNEDSGNYSGSDESWESSTEAQESSPEGQESSSGVEEVNVEAKASSEDQKSSSETQESDSEKKTDSEVQESDSEKKDDLEVRKSDSEKKTDVEVQESDSEKKTDMEVQENSSEDQKLEKSAEKEGTGSPEQANSVPEESTTETQAPNSQEEKPISKEQKTHDGAADVKCKSQSEQVKEGPEKEDETDQSKQDQQSQRKESTDQPAQPPSQVIPQQQVFDVVDNDDYLLYLEDILKKIHKVFFKEYEAGLEEPKDKKPTTKQPGGQKGATLNEKPLPDLKKIVPAVKKKVLQGVSIVFSGVVPQQVKLKDSKAYLIGTSFGATVSEKLVLRGEGANPTTHLVAANRHTEKVNAAKKVKSIKVSYNFINYYGQVSELSLHFKFFFICTYALSSVVLSFVSSVILPPSIYSFVSYLTVSIFLSFFFSSLWNSCLFSFPSVYFHS